MFEHTNAYCTIISLGFCEVSDLYLLGCWRYEEEHTIYILISSGCVFLFTICNSLVNIVVMGLVLGQFDGHM